MRFVCGVASVSLLMCFVWSIPFVVGFLCHVQSRHQTEWRCSGSHDSTGGCCDPRRLRYELQDHQAGSSFQARCGFSRFDASALSCLEFVDDKAHHENASCLCLAAILPDRLRRNWSRIVATSDQRCSRGIVHLERCRNLPCSYDSPLKVYKNLSTTRIIRKLQNWLPHFGRYTGQITFTGFR